ncbi:MAG: CinA family protein [Halococcoides sp.]
MTPPIERRVGEWLDDRSETVAVAESCTGGLIGSLLTDVPGSSAYFDRSLVTYSYAAKRECLGVSRETLAEHGAVSEPVARQMAQGVRDQSGTDWGVSTTGIAGPAGGSPDKPVGTVFVGIAAVETPDGGPATRVDRFEFDGSRTAIKRSIAEQALRELRAGIDPD